MAILDPDTLDIDPTPLTDEEHQSLIATLDKMSGTDTGHHAYILQDLERIAADPAPEPSKKRKKRKKSKHPPANTVSPEQNQHE